MGQSYIRSPMHFIWGTWRREPFITPEIENELYHFIWAKAERLGCQVLAVGGLPDHIHIAVMFPATLTYSQFAGQVKGGASHCLGEKLLKPNQQFKWQDGYGAYGFSASLKPTVISYINNQKQNHERKHLIPALEACPTSEEDTQ